MGEQRWVLKAQKMTDVLNFSQIHAEKIHTRKVMIDLWALANKR